MLATKQQNRLDAMDRFIADAGWGDATRDALAGDASFRRYTRLHMNGKSAMLMDAPPPKEDVCPFIHVTEMMRANGYSAPEIYAQDESLGFLLLEDFGDHLFSALLKKQADMELPLYSAATDLLAGMVKLCAQYPDGQQQSLPAYDNATLMREINLLADWFMPQHVGRAKALELRESYQAAWGQVFANVKIQMNVPVLRDYHADNLMWLDDREGVAKVGLLDYQDALLGDNAYDLVSFLEDIRRDVAPETVESCLNQFIEETGQGRDEFMTRYAVLGAQRNSKIVGIFTRLCVRDNKPHYLDFMPKVWRWLEHDVSHHVMAPVKAWLDEYVPQEARGVFVADTSIGSIEDE